MLYLLLYILLNLKLPIPKLLNGFGQIPELVPAEIGGRTLTPSTLVAMPMAKQPLKYNEII